jgi:DNA-directed RNA polymerase subunit RPC12/RpoP
MNCARCGLLVAGAADQVKRCQYCRERAAQLGRGERMTGDPANAGKAPR